MKKIYLFILIILSVFVLTGCGGSKYKIEDKKSIIKEKYGDVEYIIERIVVYKDLKDELPFNDEIKYIIDNKGDRGSIQPDIKRNLYLLIDIVKHEDVYKMIVYDDVAKMFAKKAKMFVMVDYFLPFTIDDISDMNIDYELNLKLNNLRANYLKVDSSLVRNNYYENEVSNAYFKLKEDGEILMQIFDYDSGTVIIGRKDDYWIANYKTKEFIYPKDLNYNDVIN